MPPLRVRNGPSNGASRAKKSQRSKSVAPRNAAPGVENDVPTIEEIVALWQARAEESPSRPSAFRGKSASAARRERRRARSESCPPAALPAAPPISPEHLPAHMRPVAEAAFEEATAAAEAFSPYERAAASPEEAPVLLHSDGPPRQDLESPTVLHYRSVSEAPGDASVGPRYTDCVSDEADAGPAAAAAAAAGRALAAIVAATAPALAALKRNPPLVAAAAAAAALVLGASLAAERRSLAAGEYGRGYSEGVRIGLGIALYGTLTPRAPTRAFSDTRFANSIANGA